MDANGQRFWIARGGGAWVPASPGTLETHGDCLRLASRAENRAAFEDAAEADARLALVPEARDAFGSRAFYEHRPATADTPEAHVLCATSGALPATDLEKLAAPATDLALGFEGYLYVAVAGEVLVRDQRKRLEPKTVALAGFDAFRLAPDPRGGCHVLERTGASLAHVSGTLFVHDPPGGFPADMFRPQPENPRPLSITARPLAGLLAGERMVALACSPSGRLAVLTWITGGGCRVRVLEPSGVTGPVLEPTGLSRPFTLAWLDESRVALRVARAPAAQGHEEAFAYAVESGPLLPLGEIYPLRQPAPGPFLHGVSLPPEYPVPILVRPPSYPAESSSRPLVPIALPSFIERASAWLGVRDSERTQNPADTTVRTTFDSGGSATAWHRLYVEAAIPKGTGFVLYAAASDEQNAPELVAERDYYPHCFGDALADGREGLAELGVHGNAPRAVWLRERSELPFHAGFVGEAPERDVSGLFTVLLQRAGKRVRTLRGRYLHLRIELLGSLRSSPRVHAVRAYGPRFAYQDHYLPELYRETVFGAEADHAGVATRADFFGRFLSSFESVLTPLEDKLAAAFMLTDPSTAPDSALEWIGSWIGIAFEPWYPIARRREHVRRAHELYRVRGTLSGMELALDLVTGGAVQQGRVIVLEDWWFRRTVATLIGVELGSDYDPLFGGPVVSGNSKVGRTLVVGEAGRRELLALFDASLELSEADAQIVADFFASLAHRATVLVHEAASEDELAAIARVAVLEAPAHIELRVRRASHDFVIGLASQLGVGTYLRPKAPPEPIEINRTRLGDGSLLRGLAALDPRLEGRGGASV
jgi:phage tail-like protein